ncbi:ABC transporter ATP-binding protein [Evansella clarkii]|uniref:ABC transporter ATP-binding protein n=1 Tax=Evansella clarkii TaxID=79879 RepID=UPI000B451EBB|nr:ABC transporter ATP-binding protein [Evansella clarkii]
MELEIRNIHHSFSGDPVMKDMNLFLKKREFVSLIGPSGCGKSTLFNFIAGLEIPDSGTIYHVGKDITGKRGHSSYMMQKDLLFPWRTVLENVLLGPSITKQHTDKIKEEALSLFPLFGLDGYEDYYPTVLSGGMKQRAALLRTFLHNKELMLLDEPFGALDALTREKMHDWLLQVWSQMQRTVLFITHSIDEAIFLSDRIYVLSPRPATVLLELEVTLPRPRKKDMAVSPEYLKLKEELMRALYQD